MRAALLSCVIVLFACGAPPAGRVGDTAEAAGSLEVRDAWAAPTPAGAAVSAGYLTIVNATRSDDRLVGASSPRAENVAVHEMSMDGGIMRMRAPEAPLIVPAATTLEFAPGGRHLMFFGAAQPFVEGESIRVTLTFERAGQIAVDLPVRRPSAQRDHAH